MVQNRVLGVISIRTEKFHMHSQRGELQFIEKNGQLTIGKLITLILDQSQIRLISLPAKWAKVSETLAVIKSNVAQSFLALSHVFSLTYNVTYYLSKPAVLSIWRSKGVRFDPSSFWGRGTFGGGGALRGSPERSIARIAWELYESLSKNYGCKEREFPEKWINFEINRTKLAQTFPKIWLKVSSRWCQNFWSASILTFSIIYIILFDHGGIHTLSKVTICHSKFGEVPEHNAAVT